MNFVHYSSSIQPYWQNWGPLHVNLGILSNYSYEVQSSAVLDRVQRQTNSWVHIRRGYNRLLNANKPSKKKKSHKKKKKYNPSKQRQPSRYSKKEEDMPILFVPEEADECQPVSKFSTFGFLSFIIAVLNAVINAVNNIDDNNNNNNDNNNNNNNLNLANSNNNQNNQNMLSVGRVLQKINEQFEKHSNAEVRRLRRHSTQLAYAVANSSSDPAHVNQIVNAGISLLHLWRQVLSASVDQWPLILCTAAANSICQSRGARLVWNSGLRSIHDHLNKYSEQNLYSAIKRGYHGKSCAVFNAD